MIAKEASILSEINHENIVKVLAVCEDPTAIMLELCEFSFEAFESDKKCSNLQQFLEYLHDNNVFEEFVPKIGNFVSKDLSSAIMFLHDNNMVHRDVKPENCLISNVHYQGKEGLSMEEIMKCPITLKLGDLGESRSSLIRTKALCTTIGSETTNVNRGTPAFMAPELLVEESKLHSASMDQLKQADIWSMMMTFFLTINPDQSVPYDNENVDSREDIIRLFKEQKQPTPNEMYRKTQSTQYQMLMYLIKRHLDFKPSCRGTAKEIHDFIVKEFTGEFLLTPLEISQSSALIMDDESYAEKLSANENNINHSMLPPLNDGTNGCAFLALGILDKLADLSITEDFIPSTIESVIRNFPLKFNQYRDVNKLYDPFEALEILGRNALLSNELKFVEDILEKHLIFTPESSNHLVSELMDMQIAAKESKSRQFGIFCGGVIIMCLSCSSTGVFTAMDTHPVSEKDKGNGNGLIVMTSSPFKLIEWLLRRADAGPDS